MVLRLYNTLTREKEDFKPHKDREVLYYTCGPTVHDFAHIGNFRTFVFQDVLKRWLEDKGFKVKHVMNITDVDEKTIERAARKKIPLSQLTGKYEKAFFEDLDCLNIKRADLYPRVSDNIDVIAGMVKGLYDRGHAILDEDGSYYYDINTFKDYGRLSGKAPRRRIRAKMPREDYNAPKNFLLWKACGEKGPSICWSTVLGEGTPGWHIECAALAERYLGRTIDIHSGGVDLIFPHHENEIAEAEGYTGQTFSRFWVHVKHLIVYGKKMSKSLGNFFTLRHVLKKGYDPRAMRVLYLKTHYRSNLNFNFKKLEQSQGEIQLVEGLIERLNELNHFEDGDYRSQIKEFKKDFTKFMDDDLQTDKAWRLFLNFLRETRKTIKRKGISKNGAQSMKETIDWVDSIFGILGECKLTP
jgi:cysteinyl-tRNA synthetase